jgi:hypothetical protein
MSKKNQQKTFKTRSVMTIPESKYKEIENRISSAESVVGIDAKKTHIIIIHMLGEILEKLDKMDERITRLEK